jgi:tRNA (pseudouridine54-N1)-methyltransferase
MRQFVVVAHDAPTEADFSLDALASDAGRMDLLARTVNAALLTSHGIREDVQVHVVVADTDTITVDGATVRNLHPDERSIAALLRGALEAKADAIGHQPAEPSPGVELRRMNLEDTLDRVARQGAVVQLHEYGTPAADLEPPTDPVFVLSDHRDFTDDEAALLDERATQRVSLGPTRLHADHAATVAHHWLDTDGWTRF